MRKIIISHIFALLSFSLIGQKTDSLKVYNNYKYVYISDISPTPQGFMYSKRDSLKASLYYGLQNKNSSDYCFMNDSCMLIHFIEDNKFVLLSQNKTVLDQFDYVKKIRGLRYDYFPFTQGVIKKTPFFGLNGNLCKLNDTLVYVSVIRKRGNYYFFYLQTKKNKIVPIIEKVDKYSYMFGDSIKLGHWKIRNIFKTRNSFFAICRGHVYAYKDGRIEIDDYLLTKNMKTNEVSQKLIKSEISRYTPYSLIDYDSTILFANNLNRTIYQFDSNLKCMDSVAINPSVKGLQTIKFLRDELSHALYIVTNTTLRDGTSYTNFYQMNNNLKNTFIKHIAFERYTDIKAINNDRVFFTYVNNTDLKYYIYTIDLDSIKMDSVIVTYGNNNPPKILTNVIDANYESWKISENTNQALSVEDFIKMKKRERRFFPKIEKNSEKYPQSNIVEIFKSILFAMNNNDMGYLGMNLLVYEKFDYKQYFEEIGDSLQAKKMMKSLLFDRDLIKNNKEQLSYLIEHFTDAVITEEEGLSVIEIEDSAKNTKCSFFVVNIGSEYFLANRYSCEKIK